MISEINFDEFEPEVISFANEVPNSTYIRPRNLTSGIFTLLFFTKFSLIFGHFLFQIEIIIPVFLSVLISLLLKSIYCYKFGLSELNLHIAS